MARLSATGLACAGVIAGLFFCACSGDDGTSDNTDLLSVVAISRHGIRSQTPPREDVNLYTQRPQGYPLWPPPADVPGNLTTRGQDNAARLGAWYRDFYAAQGLLPPRGSCPAAGTVFAYADNIERTIHTAQGYLDGMFHGEATADCGVTVQHAAAGTVDPYINTPSYPLAVTVKSDGSRAYVASQRDGCVYVLDPTDPGNIRLVSKISNLTQPSALLLNQAQTLLYVANAGSDTISVVDVAGDHAQVIATVLLRPSNVSGLPGVSPSGLALAPDEKTLYATLGDFNAVGIIDTGTNQLSGYIPVGWYPTALAATADGRALLVVNG